MQMAEGVPTFAICSLGLPSASNTWMLLLPASTLGRWSAACRFRWSTACARPHRDRFGLATQHQLNLSFRAQLDDVGRSLVDDPDVVLRIDADRLGEIESVHAGADLPHEFTG